MKPLFPRDEYEDRWNRAYEEMERRGFETAVVWGRSGGSYDAHYDTFWLTGYYSNHSGTEPDTPIWSGHGYEAVILHRRSEPSVHGTELVAVPDSFYGDWHAHPFLADGVASFLDDLKVKGRVALVGSGILAYKHAARLMELTPKIRWEMQDDLIGDLTRKKSPRELEAYREAGVISTLAMDALTKELIAGKPQHEAVAEASRILVSHGGRMHFARIVSGRGPETNRPMDGILFGFSDKKPAPGDIVRVCLTTISPKGYWMDPIRTVVCGNTPSREQRDVIEGCAEIVTRVAEAHRPGVKITDLWDVTQAVEREVVDRIDWMDANADKLAEQWPIYGHDLSILWRHASAGKGLTSNSPSHPACFKEDAVMDEGWVQTVEYFFGHDQCGYAMFEQNFIVTADGIELLTKTPMLFWD